MDNNTGESAIVPRALTEQIQPIQNASSLSAPVEMTSLGEQTAADNGLPDATLPPAAGSPHPQPGLDVTRNTKQDTQEDSKPTSSSHPETSTQEPLGDGSSNPPVSPVLAFGPLLTREKTAPAIGPSSDRPTPTPKETDMLGPVLMITLLLTNGARHPYKIDGKYLKKRNVKVDDNNPINMSTYTLKELIWREWRDGMGKQLHPDR